MSVHPGDKADMSSHFVVTTMSPLPWVDISRTLATTLLHRGSDANLNARVVQIAKNLDSVSLVGVAVFSVLGSAMYIVNSRATMRILSVVSCAVMHPVVLVPSMALSWELMPLTLQTFEFWFLSIMALVGLACSFVVFQDERTLVCYGVALFTHVALFMDASAFLRRWMFRSFALAFVGFWFVLLVSSLRLTPRLVPAKVPVGNSTGMDVLDLAIHCYTTIALFFVAKMYRSRHLVPPSRTPTTRIQCHFYFPCCRLVPVDRNNDVKGVNATNSGDSISPLRTSMADVPLPRSVTQLELANDSLPGIVDTNDSIIRRQAPNVIVRWLNVAAVVGFLCSWISLCWHIVHIQVSSTMAAQELTLSIVELVFTLWFCMIYASQATRTLFRRLISSLDAWYVSVQFTIITIGVCDAISFDRRALLVLPPWLWCHWVMILDTFSPPMKLRLGCQR